MNELQRLELLAYVRHQVTLTAAGEACAKGLDLTPYLVAVDQSRAAWMEAWRAAFRGQLAPMEVL